MKQASRSSKWSVALGLAIGLGVAGLAAANDGPPRYLDGSIRKLGRGVANIVTAPLELIRTPYFVEERDGGFAGFSVGIALGVKAAIVRELGGVIETVTFCIPIPRDFKPLVKPEFVYAHGDWVP